MTTTTTAAGAATRRPSRRAAKIATVLAVPAAIAVSGLVVSQASYSAYSSTTVSPTSNWASGTVALSDDDNNTAAFTAANLKPGSTGTQCIAVTSTGSLASTVHLYATDLSSTKDLAANIDLQVVQGTGGSFGNCAGFTPVAGGGQLYSGTVAGFAAAHTGFSNGVGNWAPTGARTESRSYQIVYTVKTTAPDTTQGGTAGVGFTWEAQNS
ncbi:hypothetical protein GCM10009616_04370 [Microlunatus lacustris]